MSDTPRTDAFCVELPATDFDCNCWSQVVAIANFAREIERETNRLRAELQSCIQGNQEYGERIVNYQRSVEEYQNQRDRSIAISDGMMAWETPAQARQSAKDLSALKKEIKDNDGH